MTSKHELKFGISLSDNLDDLVSALKIIDVSIFDYVELPGKIMDARSKGTTPDPEKNDIFQISLPSDAKYREL